MLVSHALVLGLTLLLIAGLVLAVNAVRESEQASFAGSEALVICESVKAQLRTLLHSSSYSGDYDSWILFRLPETLAGKRYMIKGNDSVMTIESELASVSCAMPAAISGSSDGGYAMLLLGVSQAGASAKINDVD